MAEKCGSSDKGRAIGSMSRRWPATIEMGPWPSTVRPAGSGESRKSGDN